jgi:hypothetical protein
MGAIVRTADLATDADEAIGLFTQYLNPAYDRARFSWLYLANPAGRGRLWLAIDDKTGQAIGTAAAFPRQVSIRGSDAIGWVFGDLCIAERYRALGPALALQRACIEAVMAEPGALFYDFPNRKLVPIYTRLRLGAPRSMRRLVKLLRVDAHVSRVLGRSRLGRAAAAAANVFVGASIRSIRIPTGVTFSLLQGPCGEEFSILERKTSADYGLCLRRSAAYVNWRYRDNPIQRHEIVAARVDGELAGWIALTHDGAAGTLVDLFGRPEPGLLAATVQAAIAILRARGCHTAAVSLLDAHPWTGLFRRIGFSLRETSPVFLGAAAGCELDPAALAATDLYLTQGDNDS